MPRVVPEYQQEARNRIIKTAVEAFSESGYHQTTMEDIAKRLGVSKAAIYSYFKDKEELLGAIDEAMSQALREEVDSLFKDTRSSGSFLDWAMSVLDWHIDSIMKYSSLYLEVLSEASRNASLRKMLREKLMKGMSIMTDLLEEQKKKRCIRQDLDTRPLALGLIALLFGIKQILLTGIDKSEASQAWRTIIKGVAQS